MQGVVPTPETDQMALYGALWLEQLVLPPPPKANRGSFSRYRTRGGLYTRVPMGPKLRTQLK